MNESDYWIDLSNRASHALALEGEARMELLVQRKEFGLVEQLKPKFSIDGNQHCVLFGENLMEGVAGFGDTPYLAVLDFNKNWHKGFPDDQ